MTDIEKLKDLEARLHEAANTITTLLASLASKDAEIERLTRLSNETAGESCHNYSAACKERARAEAAESRLTAALAALGEAKSGLVEIEAITPHKATRLCARAALAKLNALEGNEDD